MKHSASKEGYVYLFRLGEYHKIGSSKEPNGRFQAVCIMPYNPELVHTIKSAQARRVEKLLHRRFDSQRVQGEWFALSLNDVSHLCALTRVDALEDLPAHLQPPPVTGPVINRSGKPISLWLDDELYEALDRRLREKPPVVSRTRYLKFALMEALRAEGYWPPAASRNRDSSS